MRSFITLVLLFVVCPHIVRAQSTDKAQEVLAQARAALGGEKLKALQSLSATGNYRRLLGEREISGELELDLLLPDKLMKSETFSPMSGVDITRIDAMNGDKAWLDSQNTGGGNVVIRMGGDPNDLKAKAAQELAIKIDLTRLMLGLLLTTPPSASIEWKYLGTAEAPDGTADVLEARMPPGVVTKLFVDQKTHRPLMLAYQGKKPRMVTRSISAGSHEEAEKQLKENEKNAAQQAAEAAAAAPVVEMQVRFEDYRPVNGILLPHKISKSADNQISEEWELTKFKINPPLKPDKFEKK